MNSRWSGCANKIWFHQTIPYALYRVSCYDFNFNLTDYP